MLRLRLQRQKSGPVSTIGGLFIVGDVAGAVTRQCWTCEDVVREPTSGAPMFSAFDTREDWLAAMAAWVATWKDSDDTAIPMGTYDVIMTMSARFGRLLPLVIDVPGFAGIRFHPGNTEKDTRGCILPGREHDAGKVWQSVLACDELFGLKPEKPGILPTRLLAGERVTLEVLNG